ncbi:hypothetical protein Y032_0015g2791 [Ancylostoma ceylanicum]|nr:hypothetical protein Y032_0015g2791 [Ancylostoma ceylanicum]
MVDVGKAEGDRRACTLLSGQQKTPVPRVLSERAKHRTLQPPPTEAQKLRGASKCTENVSKTKKTHEQKPAEACRTTVIGCHRRTDHPRAGRRTQSVQMTRKRFGDLPNP